MKTKNARLNNTIQRLCKFMDIRMIKASEVDGAIHKATARQTQAYEEEKKKADYYRQAYVKEKQKWEEENQRLKEQLEANRRNYEQELLCKDQETRHLARALKEKDQEILRLENASTDWEGKYEEVKTQMDYQLLEKDQRYQVLLQKHDDLQFEHEQANEELRYRRAEKVQLQQTYERNAIRMIDRWASEKREYDARIEREHAEEINGVTAKVDRAMGEAAKIYKRIQDYREETLGKGEYPRDLTIFLDEILMLAYHVEGLIKE